MSYQYGTEPKEVINGLLAVQWNRYEYEDFLIVLKNRLRKYTGKDEVMFFSEEELVDMLHELNIVSFYS
ncbi:hypothetical protein SAMN04487777_11740 [Priestia aryabhattai B8W22]|uniref:hypothetical protein n=1 Tax=Priestia aryabhattai TaxID=412384 RepID=UPI000886CBC2|nr:hypothetical protein SAMN04487777_11740 [Priestia aryabhattai B8W22]